MKNMPMVFFVLFFLCSSIFGEISTQVYLRDCNELLGPIEVNETAGYIDYGEIMNGTELAIVIDSNAAEGWSGRLLLEDENMDKGQLYGREPYDEFEGGYIGSIFEAAGYWASVYPGDEYWEAEDKYVQGFDLYTDSEPEIGEWFIVDYNSIAVGDVNIAFYWQQPYPPFDYGLIYQLKFENVRTRDFDSNYKVDFGDYSILAGYWYQPGCSAPDWCEGADLDTSGIVDMNDLALFADYWLEKTR